MVPTTQQFPIMCESIEELRFKISCFIRDMKMQNKSITLRREKDIVMCPETGNRWSVTLKKHKRLKT